MEVLKMLNRSMLTCDGEPPKPPFLLQGLNFSNGCIAADDDRVHDEAVLKSLNLLHHLCLGFCRAVVMNNTQSALQGHVNCHLMLSDSVHGGGNKRSSQGDALRDWGFQVDIGSCKANITWQDEKVVVCQAAMLLRVDKRLDIKSIAFLVLTQGLESLGVV